MDPFLFGTKKKELPEYEKKAKTVLGNLARYYFRCSSFFLSSVCPKHFYVPFNVPFNVPFYVPFYVPFNVPFNVP